LKSTDKKSDGENPNLKRKPKQDLGFNRGERKKEGSPEIWALKRPNQKPNWTFEFEFKGLLISHFAQS